MVEGGRVRSANGNVARVSGRRLAAVVGFVAGETPVQAPDDPPPVAQQLAEEPQVLDTQVYPPDVVLGEAGHPRYPADEVGTVGRREPAAARQSLQVRSRGQRHRLVDDLSQRPAAGEAVLVR